MENNITSYSKDKAITGLRDVSQELSDAQFEKEIYEKLQYHIKKNIDVFVWLRDQ
jgi:hypothetical protein